MRYFFLIVFLSSSLLANVADSLELPVIRVADKIVTGDEFLERYELTPQEGKSSKRDNTAKLMNFAYTIIAEKLLATEAAVLGLDSTEAIRIATEAFKQMFLRDALYKKVIREKVEISPKEMKEGLIRNSQKLFLYFLFSEDDKEIFNLYNLLLQGIPFDTILAESPELAEQPAPLEVVFGQMDPGIEDSLYKLKPGNFTSPLYTPDGWYIFKLVNRQEQAEIFFDPQHESYKNSEKIIRLRKEQKLYKEYFMNFFAGKNIQAVFIPMKSLAAAVSQQIKTRRSVEKMDPAKTYQLDALDIISIRTLLGKEDLNKTIVSINGRDISVNNFLLRVAFDGLQFNSDGTEEVFQLLYKTTRKFIETELLADEAVRLGLESDPAVIRDLAMWRENYLSQALQSQFLDSVSVSDAEARAEYEKIFKEKYYPPQINLFRIFADQPGLADSIIRRNREGEDLVKIFNSFNSISPSRLTGGESGYAIVSDFGEAGEIGYRMEVGEVYGPLKTGNGYLIFKVLGKKSDKLQLPEKSFEEMKDKIKTRLRFERSKAKMRDYTSSLAVKYGFSIDTKVMESLRPTGINSFGMRSLGFGGTATAVPLLAPNYEWIFRYLDDVRKLNP